MRLEILLCTSINPQMHPDRGAVNILIVFTADNNEHFQARNDELKSHHIHIPTHKTQRRCTHADKHTCTYGHRQYIEQDKPRRAVRGWCLIGLCGATAALIINSSEDPTTLITLSLSEWRWSQKRARAHIHRCPAHPTSTRAFFPTTVSPNRKACCTQAAVCSLSEQFWHPTLN